MSKFCENCGAELKNTDTACPNCGAPVENSEPKDVKVEENTNVTENVTETVNTNTTASSTKPEKKNNTKLYAIIGGAIALVLIIIICLIVSAYNAYKKPVNTLFKAMETGNYNKMLNAFPSVMKDDLKDNIDEDDMDTLKEALEDTYGKNTKITYKITDKEKIDKDDLKDLQDELQDEYDKKSKTKVTAGYELTLDIKFKGKDDHKTFDDVTVSVYKIGGKWCILTPPSGITSNLY